LSWWSGNYEDEGCTKALFKIWLSGYRIHNYGGGAGSAAQQRSVDVAGRRATLNPDDATGVEVADLVLRAQQAARLGDVVDVGFFRAQVIRACAPRAP
jgi:hypothetical protein